MHEKHAGNCTYCGGRHGNRRDYLECRARGGQPVAEPPPSRPATPGNPTTRYSADPLKGNKRDHHIVRRAKAGWPERKIAKRFQISVGQVREALEKAGLR